MQAAPRGHARAAQAQASARPAGLGCLSPALWPQHTARHQWQAAHNDVIATIRLDPKAPNPVDMPPQEVARKLLHIIHNGEGLDEIAECMNRCETGWFETTVDATQQFYAALRQRTLKPGHFVTDDPSPDALNAFHFGPERRVD